MKLKLIALAVAGLAAAGSANAAYDHGYGDGNGDTELFLFAFDATNNIQGFFDLGVNLSTFLPANKGAGTSNSWNLAANTTTGLGGVTGSWSSAWNTFLAGSTAANTTYMVGAVEFDALGVALTTSNTPRSQINTQLDATLQNFVVSDSTLTGNTNLGNHSTVANGANTAQGTATGPGIIGSGFGNNWNANFAGNAFEKIGVAQNTYLLSANFSGGPADVTQYAGKFNLTSAGVLSYTAPVPEPETYALMLAGLGMLGMIARRRRVL